jgi:hypothetical protein
MNNVLALQMVAHVTIHPGVFKVFGFWTTPTLLGQVLHAIAVYFKYIAVAIILLLLWWKGKVEVWKILFILAIGMVAIPSWSPKVAHYTSDVTKGSAVGSTGASAGLVIFLLILLGFTIYRMLIKRPVIIEDEAEQK